MKPKAPVFDAYMLDTCKIVSSGKYLPGAILLRGRKRVETVNWKQKTFSTQREADAFVMQHFDKLGIRKPADEIALYKILPSW